MNIFATWWARFVQHKLRKNGEAATDVRRRLKQDAPKPEKQDRKD